MASYTPNINLKKPTTSEYYNVLDENSNKDKIDTAIGNLNSQIVSMPYFGAAQNKTISLNQTSGVVYVADFSDLTAPTVTGRTFVGYVGFIDTYRAAVLGFGGQRCYYIISAPTTADATVKVYPMYI